MQQEKLSGKAPNMKRVIIVKIGGSSVTDKATKESVNESVLDWFAQSVSDNVGKEYKAVDDTDISEEGTAFDYIEMFE